MNVQHCRLCHCDDLWPFLDLGFTPPADDFLKEARLREPEIHYPLQVVRCNECNFIQLDYVVAPDILYQNDYPYESSTTQTGRDHFNDFAASAAKRFSLDSSSLVVDIGSNVGVLLGGFKRLGMQVLGVEPAKNIAEIAIQSGIPTLAEFFSEQAVEKIVGDHQKAQVVTTSNVFAHVDDLDTFVGNVLNLLDDDGVFIIEAPYLLHLLDNLEYDTIYHEHLSYISIEPLVRFFGKYGMEIFDISQVEIHGGSIRIFVGREGRHEATSRVQEHVRFEKESGALSDENLTKFSRRVQKHRNDLVWLLKSLKRDGKRIAAISAPAKGMTLLNYCKIGKETLEFVTEKSSLKIGRYTPGSHLSVFDDSKLLEENIDYALLLAWNFKDEIIKNSSEFRNNGGKFIIPIPEPIIV